MLKKNLSEFLATFSLIFFGCGAMVVNQLYDGIIGHIGTNLVFGLIIMVMIYSVGDISGAHMNPAVTFAFYIDHQLDLKTTFYYIVSQLIGSLSASLVLKLLFPKALLLGNTIPTGSYLQVFVLEFIVSFLLFLLIVNVSEGPKETGMMAGIAVGSYIMVSGLFAGPVGGNSLNPARTLGPAIVTLRFDGLYLYLIAPVLGTTLASKVSKVFRN